MTEMFDFTLILTLLIAFGLSNSLSIPYNSSIDSHAVI